MKHLLFSLIILSIASGVGADSTTDALNAPLVQDSITLSLGSDNGGASVINYRIDTNTSPKTADGITFRSNDEISICIGNFNPLTEKWTVESKATPDPSFTAIQAFLDDLRGLQSSLPQPAASPLGGGNDNDPQKQAQGGPGCTVLQDLISQAYAALTTPTFTADELRTIISGAHGNAGVESSYGMLGDEQQEITDNITLARSTLDSIRNNFGGLNKKPSENCGDITSRILIDYIEVHSIAERIIAKKEALRQQLADLSKVLEPFRDAKDWRGPSLTDFAIHKVTPTFAEQQNVTASVQEKTVSLTGNNTIETKTGEAAVAKMDVRKNSLVVVERAVAVVYNSLTYPQYGTETTDDGKMIVQRIEDHEPIDGALMLNLIPRLRSPSVVYPFLQIGVSSAKDFPGFLTGLGIRFVDPFNFSISIGGMITRYKDLNGDLKEGDEVSGTAEIQDHLEYKTSKVALYGAIQLKF